MSQTFTVQVMGTGTSAGIPVIACDCPVCTSANPHNQRLRASIVMRNGEQTVLVDCGSDFRQQALLYRINRLDALLLTHAHSDHVSGLDELRLYNWKQGQPIPTYASPITWDNVRKRFDYIFSPLQKGGGVPEITVHEVEQPFRVLGRPVVPLPVMHGLLPVLGFRFGNFAYITDASYVPDETIEAARGVRYLILNALRYKPHPTHLNVEQATAVARRIGAERTWFTHITHDVEHEAGNRGLPPDIQFGHDGLEFQIEWG